MPDLKKLFAVCDKTKVWFVKPVKPLDPNNKHYFAQAGQMGAAMFDERDCYTVIETFTNLLNKEFVKISIHELLNMEVPEFSN